MAWFRISFTSVLGLYLLLSTSVIAAEKIAWRDLTVPVDPQDDPYFSLNFEQRKNLESVFRIANKRLIGEGLTLTEKEEEQEAVMSLSDNGIDVDMLKHKNRLFLKKIKLQRTTVRNEWDNKDIEIPGYVVPLEFSDERVTEFILVPYVGACIHTPPPPGKPDFARII